MTASAIRNLPILFLLAAGLLAGCNWRAGNKPASETVAQDPKTVEADVALIREYLEKGKEDDAIKAAEKFLENHPDAPEREEVMMLAAKAEMARGYYYNAYEFLERQLSNYPGGTLSEQALNMEYQIAEAYLQGRKRKALKIFRLPAEEDGLVIMGKIPQHAPSTAMAEKALIRIADQHWSKERWTKAADAYDDYLSLFPKGSQAEYAMFQAARATYASYRGEKYDDTPLIDAEQRFLAYRRQFPQEAAKNRVDGILGDIADSRAAKLYYTASFYERTDKRPSARYYYEQLAEKYPNSDYAVKARTALRRLGDVKAEPDSLSRPLAEKVKKAEEPSQAASTDQSDDNRADFTNEPGDVSQNPASDTGVETVQAEAADDNPAETKKEKPIYLEELMPQPEETRADQKDSVEGPAASQPQEGRADCTDEAGEPSATSEPESAGGTEEETPPADTSTDKKPAENEKIEPIHEESTTQPEEGRADA